MSAPSDDKAVHHCQPNSLVWVQLDDDGQTWRLNHDALGTIVEFCPFCGKRLSGGTATPSVTEFAREVLRLDEGATPGPWEYEQPGYAVVDPCGKHTVAMIGPGRIRSSEEPEASVRSNWTLIATYRTAAPALARALLAAPDGEALSILRETIDSFERKARDLRAIVAQHDAHLEGLDGRAASERRTEAFRLADKASMYEYEARALSLHLRDLAAPAVPLIEGVPVPVSPTETVCQTGVIEAQSKEGDHHE